jgi:hypothetical protein
VGGNASNVARGAVRANRNSGFVGTDSSDSPHILPETVFLTPFSR